MLKKIERKMEGEQLMAAQKTYFILGFTLDFLGDPKFPFESEPQRRSLWEKTKDRIQAKMYEPRIHGNFREPAWNALRANEWWEFDTPESKRILNGAKKLNNNRYDFWPAEETDQEFLTRLNLLSEDDLEFIKRHNMEFWRAENDDIEFRRYMEEEDRKELQFQATTKDENGRVKRGEQGHYCEV
jgi:hypothetical protein